MAAAILPGQLTIAFGMFGVVVALPNIMTAFGGDVDAAQWVMTAYLIARVVPMPALGWMTSMLGNRRLYVFGVLGTTVATVLCGMAWNMASLITFRILQVHASLEAARHVLLEAGESTHTAPTTALAVVANMLGEQARIAAYQDCFLVVGGIFLLALLPAWLSRSHRSCQRHTPAPVTLPPVTANGTHSHTPVPALSLPREAEEQW